MTTNETKLESYYQLLEKRRADRFCEAHNCVNPWHDIDLQTLDKTRNVVDLIDFSSEDVVLKGGDLSGQRNLDVEVLILGQDYADVDSVRCKVKSGTWPKTDHFGSRVEAIKEVLANEGLRVANNTFTSNLVPFLKKTSHMGGHLSAKLIKHCAREYARELIDIVAPKAVYLLGAVVTRAIFREYGLLIEGRFNDVVDAPACKVLNGPWMVPVAHPGGRGWANRKVGPQAIDRLTQHVADWRRGWPTPN